MRAKDEAAYHPSVSVAFAGSRHGMTRAQRIAVSTLLRIWGASLLVHGDCVGADSDADWIAERLVISRVIHPGNIEAMRAHCERRGALQLSPPMHPLDRNRMIPRWCDVLIACPRATSRGTWHTVGLAAAMYKPIVVIDEAGTATNQRST